MSPMIIDRFACDYGFPRVSGDEPKELTLLTFHVKFSPRERG